MLLLLLSRGEEVLLPPDTPPIDGAENEVLTLLGPEPVGPLFPVAGD